MNTFSPTHCTRASCTNQLKPNETGRPSEYCSTRCRQAAHRDRLKAAPPDTQHFDAHLRDGLAQVALYVERMARTLNDPSTPPEEPLRQLTDIQRTLEQLTPAAVGRARKGKATWEVVGGLLSISRDRARRRFSAGAIERSLARRTTASARGHRAPSTPATRPAPGEEKEEAQQAAETGRGAPPPSPPPPDRNPERLLACALSNLQRDSGHSLRALGLRTGLSASYLSRVMTGDRFPTWVTTVAIATACGTDPQAVREVWDHANDHRRRTRPPHSSSRPEDSAQDLAGWLRYLHLRAGSPTTAALALRSTEDGHTPVALHQQTVHALLDGTTPGEWEEVQRLVQLLDGEESFFRPRWHTARVEADSPTPPPAEGGPPAEADSLLNPSPQAFAHRPAPGRTRACRRIPTARHP